jgi:hypothetical protein
MDLISAIIGTGIVLLCALPFIFHSISRKKREKHLFNLLTDMANEHNCNLTEHEVSSDFAIGIDKINSYFFFVTKSKENETRQHINLADFQSCKVIAIDDINGNNDDINNGTEKLFLSLIPIVKEKPIINLELFDEAKRNRMNGQEEKNICEKWSIIINNKLKDKR